MRPLELTLSTIGVFKLLPAMRGRAVPETVS